MPDFWTSTLLATSRGAGRYDRATPQHGERRVVLPKCPATRRRTLVHVVAPNSHRPIYTLPLAVSPQSSTLQSVLHTPDQFMEVMLQQDVQDFLDVSRLTPTAMTYDVDILFTIRGDVMPDTVVRIGNIMEYIRADMRLEPNTGSENPFNWIATVPLPLKQRPRIESLYYICICI